MFFTFYYIIVTSQSITAHSSQTMNTFSKMLSSKVGSATEDSVSTTYDEYGIKVVDNMQSYLEWKIGQHASSSSSPSSSVSVSSVSSKACLRSNLNRTHTSLKKMWSRDS